MTRIGFAYNQKPEAPELLGGAEIEAPRGDDKPPSTRRDGPSRNTAAASARSDASFATPLAPSPGDDQYAEWDSIATLDAVANALAECGDVIRLEATADFPQALRHQPTP